MKYSFKVSESDGIVEFQNCSIELIYEPLLDALKEVDADLSSEAADDVHLLITNCGFFNLAEEGDVVKLFANDVSSSIDQIISLLEASSHFKREKSAVIKEKSTAAPAEDRGSGNQEWISDDERPFDSTFWM